MDLLNLAGDERLDYGDLTFALNEAPTGLVNEVTGKFLIAPGASSIITGFRPSGSGQGPVQVGDSGTANVALLGQRLSGVITQGVFSAVGPSSQSIAISTLPANTYGIFVRFNRLPGQTQSRKFWSKASPGAEYSQIQSTRLVASWEARIEVSAPSAEWVQIGKAVITSGGSGQGNTVVVTDQRNLYFEGNPSASFAPSWGSAADRSSDRSTANTGNLQRQLDAIRQCILDIKGRGIATWYQPNISGLQVGTGFGLSDSPSPNQIYIGDYNFYLSLYLGNPYIAFAGTGDQLKYTRSSSILSRTASGTTLMNLYGNGGAMFGAGAAQGFFTINPVDFAQYGLNIYTSGSTPAALGINSTGATSAILELGRNGYTNSYAYLRATWSNNTPTVQLANQNITFLTATMPAGASQPYVNLTGSYVQTNTANLFLNASNGMYLNGKQQCLAGAIFAVGYVSQGTNDASKVSCVYGGTVTAARTSDASNNKCLDLTWSGVNVPNPATVLITPSSVDRNTTGLSPQYFQNGNTIRVHINTDNAESVYSDFAIMVLYGNS